MNTENTFPLNYKPTFFAGKKPTKLIIGKDELPVQTWKEVARIMLKICSNEKHEELLAARNKIIGRKRTILSDTADGMNRPMKISEDIYFEGHLITRNLLSLLCQTLDAVGYDYSEIRVRIREY